MRGHRSSPLISNLGVTLNLPVKSVHRLLKANSPNGLLTTIAALSLIGEALEMPMVDLINTEILL
ncbi:MAG: hypothetical protein ACOH1N_14210 [Lutibacter sp.]